MAIRPAVKWAGITTDAATGPEASFRWGSHNESWGLSVSTAAPNGAATVGVG